MKIFTKKCVAIAIFIVTVSFCFGQLNHQGRGMYVDKFFQTTINASGQTIVNSARSILTIQSKEDELLLFAKENHITYLLFYDLHHVLGTTYQTDFCNFIHKARTMYCIELIGIASACSGLFDEVGIALPTPVYYLPQNFQSSALDFVEHEQDPRSYMYYQSESAKLFLRAADFNDICPDKIDVFVTEYEYWNGAGNEDNCTGDTGVTKNDKWIRFQSLVNIMDGIRDDYNDIHTSHKIFTEAYIGFLDNDEAAGIQNSDDIAEWLDDVYTTTSGTTVKRLDRLNTIYYHNDPTNLYNGHNDQLYYNTRFLELGKNTTQPNTNIHPMFSAEYKPWGDPPPDDNNYLGFWINQNIHNNIFTAEKAWYDDWIVDKTLTPFIADPTWGNIIQPGGVQWFTSRYMVPHFKDPILFTSNSPVCIQNGNGTFHFNYQGPIEQGLNFKFYITDAGSSNVRCGNLNSKVWPIYNETTFSSIDLDGALAGSCNLPVGSYDAHLELTYTSGCNYDVPVVPLSVVNSAQIISTSTNSTLCVGDPIFLQASSTQGGSTNYQWLVDGAIPPSPQISNEFFFAPKPPAPGDPHTRVYSCSITSSLGSCSANPSNPITISFEDNPVPTINVLNHNQCTIELQVQPSGLNYLWHDNSTLNNYSTNFSGTYTVLATTPIAGCSKSTSFTYKKHQIIFETPINACFGGSDGSVKVKIENGSPDFSPYTINWTGPLSGSASTTGLFTISNLSAGTYSVTVTDRDGCSKTASTTIGSNAQITATTSSTPSTCQNSSDGTATVTNPTGGTPPYSYHWQFNNSTANTISGLLPGNYPVDIIDNVPCTTTVIINVPYTSATTTATFNLSSNLTNPLFLNCDAGSTNILTVSNPAHFGSNPTFAWMYIDESGNSQLYATTNSPSIQISGISCFWNYFYVIVTPSSDACPSGPITSSPSENLVIGSFTGTNNEVTAWAQVINSTCSNLNNGTITVGLRYPGQSISFIDVSWSGTSSGSANFTNAQTSYLISSLAPGLYHINIGTYSIDTYVNSTNVSPAPIISSNYSGYTCGASLSTEAYSNYLWQNDNSSFTANTQSITAPASGYYIVTVTNAAGCIGTSSSHLVNLNVDATISGLHSTCVTNYSVPLDSNNAIYNWSVPSGSSFSQNANSIIVNWASAYSIGGTITCTVANACGRTATSSIQVSPFLATVNSTASCSGLNNGKANVSSLTGGTAPYTYHWNSGTNTTSQLMTNLSAGTYTVTVTDNNNCTTTASTVVSSFPSDMPAPIISGLPYAGAHLYTITNYNSAYDNYYSWNAIPNFGNVSISYPNNNKESAIIVWPISGGVIHLTFGLTGCQLNTNFIVSSSYPPLPPNPKHPVEEFIERLSDPSVKSSDFTESADAINSFKLFPNPTTGKISLNYNLLSTENGLIEITNILGVSLYYKKLNPESQQLEIDLSELKPAIYFFKIVVDGKQIHQGKISIIR